MNSIIDHKKLIIFLSILLVPASFPKYSFLSSMMAKLLVIAALAYAMFDDAKEAIIAFVISAILMFVLRNYQSESFILGPDTDALNSCQGIKYSQILALFGGDEEKLKAVAYWDAGLPFDVTLDDNGAPVIMSYLANYDCKYRIGACGLPPANDTSMPGGYNSFGLDQL